VDRPGGQFRLDVVTDTDPDNPIAVSYFDAPDTTAAADQARELLAAHNGPANRYGDLYKHDGDGAAIYYDTIDLPQ
jgi:hypothetical protein